jgi:hypothetical protein
MDYSRSMDTNHVMAQAASKCQFVWSNNKFRMGKLDDKDKL